MHRIVVTGPNGAGKTTFARRLAADRPDLPLIHFDALKLTTAWKQRDRAEIEARLGAVVETPGWILEGGPSLLPRAMPQADALVWLDPPLLVRALRLARRPWGGLGRTRPELPDGNPDRLWQQYRFGWRSLRHNARFRAEVAEYAAAAGQTRVWRCRSLAETNAAHSALDGGRPYAAEPPTVSPPISSVG